MNMISISLRLLFIFTITLSFNPSSALKLYDITTFKSGAEDMMSMQSRLISLSAFSEISCAIDCIHDEDCISFFWNKLTGMCSLYSRPIKNLSLQEEDGWVGYDFDAPAAKLKVCPVMTFAYIFDKTVNFCYKVHNEPLMWVDAKVACQNESGVLAKVDTAARRELVDTIVREDGSTDYYLGGTDEAEDGVWRWIADNSVIAEMTITGTKDCMEIKGVSQQLDDANCAHNRQKFICEVPLPR